MIRFRSRSIAACALALAAASALAAPPHYSAVVLTAPNHTKVEALALGPTGEVVGDAHARTGEQRSLPASFAMTASSFEAFSPLDSDYSIAYGVAGNGDVVGRAGYDGDGASFAYLRKADGTIIAPLAGLGFQRSSAAGVNSAGTIIGGYAWSLADYEQPYAWKDGVFTPLPTHGFPNNSVGAVNDAGLIVGAVQTDDFGTTQAATWIDGVLAELPGLSPYGSLGAAAVSSNGLVAGDCYVAQYVQHPCLWTGGKVIDLGDLGGGHGAAHGVNASGTVVGDSTPPNPPYAAGAFVWMHGHMYNLNHLVTLPPQWFLQSGQAINDAGQILATGRTANGIYVSLLLTPETR
jgi:uncharacterized membrane protein